MAWNQRHVVDEIMDGADVDPLAHAQALAGLRRINSVSNTAARMVRPIVQLARQSRMKQLSLLDIACGGGDVSIGIASAARRAGIEIDLTLLDRSATALKLAGQAAKTAGIKAFTSEADLLEDWNLPSFDIVTCSLFLHHLARPEDVVDLLKRMRMIARRLVVVSDLRRCRAGGAAAWVGSRMLSRSPIVHFDAPASVRAAWTQAELSEFSSRAGMIGATIERCWPWRMLLVWNAGEITA